MVGSYQLPVATEPWKEMQEAGFNLIHAGANREELDQARARKMYAWVTLGSIAPAKRAEGEAGFRKAVEEFKSPPALLYWETEDEPWLRTSIRWCRTAYESRTRCGRTAGRATS
jgi:hypothetical protein